MEDLELIERYFRKELNTEESARLDARLTTDPEFKRKFETESLVHKAIQFSRERAMIRAYASSPALSGAPASKWLDNKALGVVAGTALAVWVVSTFSSSVVNVAPQNIKWIGIAVSIAAALLLMVWSEKSMTFNGVAAGLFNAVLIFILASGMDAINQGARGITDKAISEAHLIPFTEEKAWWPTHSLEDSLALSRKRILDLGNQIKLLVGSRLSTGPNFNLGLASGKFSPVVVPVSSTVSVGSNYEADLFLATSPIQQTLEMRVDGKAIPLINDPSGVKKGKVWFKATANQFDKSGMARKEFAVEIVVGDSTYRRTVEYAVRKY
jgi:hypothetical protein